MVKSQTTSITPAQHATTHIHGGTDPLTGDIRIDEILTDSRTMTDVSGSRALGTNYQNTNDRPMNVSVDLTSGNAAHYIAYVKATSPADHRVGKSVINGTWSTTLFFIVPPGYYYRVTLDAGGGGDTVIWHEWL